METLEASGVPVLKFIAAGGLPDRNKVLMQIYADVINREIGVVRSAQAPALGSAMHAAVAAGEEAGGYPDIATAARHMGGLRDEVFRPVPEHVAVYDRLFAEYKTLYDYFGRGGNDVMKRLRALRLQTLTTKEASAEESARTGGLSDAELRGALGNA